MFKSKPLEGLLRPPVEWLSCIAGLMLIILMICWPVLFNLPTISTAPFIILITLFSLWRFKQGYRIFRYHRRLQKMPHYSMRSDEIPIQQNKLFLGKGFLWTTQLTQRLRDLDLAVNKKYKYPARHKKYPDIGGLPCLHGVADTEYDVMMKLADRGSHLMVLGLTGMGKTRLAELLIAQDIKRGDVVIVFDPKGDFDLLQRICQEAILAGRKNDVLIFHLGFPEVSCRYNPIAHFTKVTQVATRLTNGLPSSGEAAAFKEFAWRYVNLVTRALVALEMCPTYKLIQFYITKLNLLFLRFMNNVAAIHDPEFEKWITNYQDSNSRTSKNGREIIVTRDEALFAYAENKVAERNHQTLSELQNDLLSELLNACKLDKTYYDKITASIGPLLEKLTTGEIGDLLSPDYQTQDDPRPIFNWLEVIKQNKIVYVGMDALTDQTVASCVGNAMLADLVSVAGFLYKFGFPNKSLPAIRLHADEVNEMMGDEFVPLLNKARGAGFSVVAYTQTWSDMQAKLGSEAKTGQVAGNLGTLIMFRCNEEKTIHFLLSKLPEVPILRVLPASSSQDSAHAEKGVFYHSSNEDRLSQHDVKLITANDVVNLPKGQAFVLLEGGKLYKIRIPLPKQESLVLPGTVVGLVKYLIAFNS